MEEIYYSPKGHWKGYAAIPKLAEAANVSKLEAENFLKKQALWQIYLPAPKYIPRPHWVVSKTNQIHQADLLFLPHDIVKRKTYKYCLVVVDVATSFVDAEALTSKESQEVASALSKIYSRTLKFPETLIIDPGREFMGNVTKLLEKHNVKIQRSEAKNHRAQAFVERANRTLSEKIFSIQSSEELITNKYSRVWVKELSSIIKGINDQREKLTKKEYVTKKYKRPVGLKELRLPPSVQVRYLYAPGEFEGGDRRRATDAIWSYGIHNIGRSIVSENQPVLYFLLNDAPKRGFVLEELQVVPENTILPPEGPVII